MSDGPDPAPAAASHVYSVEGPSRRTTTLLIAAFVLVILASVSAFVPVPYVVLSPGPITNVVADGSDGKPIITVSGATTYPAEGALNFTTVREVGRPGSPASALETLWAAIDPAQDVYPIETLYPEGTTDQQVQEVNTAEMVDSQQVATAVALEASGATVTRRTIVSRVQQGSPSSGKLEGGDQITTIDATAVSTPDQIRAAIRTHQPGETVTVTVLRDGKTVRASVVTASVDGNAALGVLLGTAFDFPFTVAINVGEVGGPSAGTMLALGIYDLLTPGNLTGGQDIAGTGTLAEDGTVGPIGGIAQKLVGAKDGGAQWFLAPASNCDDVLGRVPDGLRVVKIATFEQALADVKAIAAGQTDDLPTCTAADVQQPTDSPS